MNAPAKFVPMERFGKDHWSVLGYVDSCCAEDDTNCTLDKGRMRCNCDQHPEAANDLFVKWSPCYGTHLIGFYEASELIDPIHAIYGGVLLPEHDDWDCLHDLQDAGLIKIMSESAGRVRLTKEGIRVAALIRSHRQQGGLYHNFRVTSGQVIDRRHAERRQTELMLRTA